MDQNPVEFVSQLKPFSIGIVVVDKPYDTDEIVVFPSEHMFNHEGAVDKDEHTITAKWLPRALSNRWSSPDVCVGESVEVFRYADTDTYYWTTMKVEPALRKKEDVLYLWSNVPRGSDEVAGANNSYWLHISAVEGKVHFHTPDNDSEACTYDVSFDTKKGIVVLADGLGNTVTLISKSGKLLADVKQEIVLVAGKSITLSAGETITLSAPKVNTVGETFTAKASQSATMDTPTTNTKAMSIKGSINHSGELTSTGGHTAAGYSFA